MKLHHIENSVTVALDNNMIVTVTKVKTPENSDYYLSIPYQYHLNVPYQYLGTYSSVEEVNDQLQQLEKNEYNVPDRNHSTGGDGH